MKQIFRLITLLLIPLFLLIAGGFVLYPKYSQLKILKNSLDIEQISHKASLRGLTAMSPQQQSAEVAGAQFESIAVESISPEALAKFQNSGSVYRKVEENNTELKIKSADINGAVYDGEDGETMWRGLWHFPLSVGPGDKGNFVVIAHRFHKIPPETDTFYNLDKVVIGDKIEITQDGGINYTYTVTETKVVEKNDRSVLAPTNKHTITLITCHPLWTSDQRLVVVGVLDKVYQNI